jgi:predicted nucleic acid-binding Zn ribbon protein
VSEGYPQPVDPKPNRSAPSADSGAVRPQPVDASAPTNSATPPAAEPAAAPAASGADLARQALARARAQARERGAVPRGMNRNRKRGRLRSRNEPQLFGDAVRTWLIEHGWQEQVAVGGVFGRWSDIVGDFNAEHLRPESYSEGELVVVADSPTMAAHARAMVRDLMRRLNEELGEGTVVAIKVKGPGSRRR